MTEAQSTGESRAHARIKAPSTPQQLRALERLVSGELAPPPIAKFFGFRLVEIALGRSTAEMDADGRYANPMGTLHGGVICDLADIALGTAMATTLEADETFTTLDLTAKYFKPVWDARLRARALVVKRTRSLGLIECEVTDETDSLVAKVYSSCMVLRGEKAEGR